MVTSAWRPIHSVGLYLTSSQFFFTYEKFKLTHYRFVKVLARLSTKLLNFCFILSDLVVPPDWES